MSASTPLFAAGDKGAEYDTQIRDQIRVYETAVEENLSKLAQCNPGEAEHYRGRVEYAKRGPRNGQPIPDNITGSERTQMEVYDLIWQLKVLAYHTGMIETAADYCATKGK